MGTSNRSEAQQRADDIRAFQAELARLEGQGVLRLDQTVRAAVEADQQALLTRLGQDFGIDRSGRDKQLSLGMKVASFLGALALAASVFFLFYQFWGWLDTPVQVVVLVTAALASFLGALWIQQIDSSGYFAKLAAMVAFACFVLDLSMLGQIFNITPSDKALLAWAALALLLAYGLDLRLLLVAGIVCLVAFLAARIGTWGGVYWIHFGQRPENFFAAAVLLFLLPRWIDHRRHAGFDQTWRIAALLSLFIPMLVLAHWGSGSYLNLAPSLIEGLYQVLGFALTALATWLGVRRQQGEVVNTSVSCFVIFLYTKLHDWWWEAMPKYLFFLVLSLIAVLLLFILRRLRSVDALPAQPEVLP